MTTTQGVANSKTIDFTLFLMSDSKIGDMLVAMPYSGTCIYNMDTLEPTNVSRADY